MHFYNVHLETGEKMKNVPSNRLKHYEHDNGGDGDEVESMAPPLRTRTRDGRGRRPERDERDEDWSDDANIYDDNYDEYSPEKSRRRDQRKMKMQVQVQLQMRVRPH